jgi:drug/metabolite transporter (DMT)-like permease
MGVFLALLSMLCFASNIIISRYAMAQMKIEPGFLVVLVVNVLFAAGLFGAELLLRAATFELHWREAGLFALAGIVGTYLGRRLLFDTVRLLGPARASVFHSSAPVFTLIAAWLLVGERLGGYELALMALVMTGLWITQPAAGGAADAHRPSGAALRRGMLTGILTVAGFGVGNAIRGLAMRSWSEAVFGALAGSLAALACQLATTHDHRRVLGELRAASAAGIALYAASGIATVCGSIFIVSAMAHMEIALAALVTHTTPLAIFPVSVLVYRNREGLTLRTALGAGCVLTGIVLLAMR